MINKMSLNGFNYPKLGKFLILGILILGFILNIYFCFWGALPFPSDALQYLGPSSFGTTWGCWAWPDRFLLAIGLRLTTLATGNIPYGGIFYIASCSFFIVLLSMYIAFKETGYWGAIACYIFLTTSQYVLFFFTKIYPNQTLALFSLISFYIYFYFNKENKIFNRFILTGFFSAFVLFSKITGIILIVYFIIYTLRRYNFTCLIKYFLGLFIGALTVFVLFILLYNWESFINSIQMFFESGIATNFNSRGSNAVSYLSVLLDMNNFQIFISLFIFVGAYKNLKSKKIYFMAISYIFIIYLIYGFSRRGGEPIPLYIYTAFIFTAIGFSVYLTDDFKKNLNYLFKEKKLKLVNILIHVLIVLLLIIGFIAGHYKPGGIVHMYETSNVKFCIKWAVTFFPIVIVILLSLFEYFKNDKRKKAIVVITLLLLSSFWFSLVNGAYSLNKFKKEKKRAQFFYENAPLLNKVKQKTFVIYIKNWNSFEYSYRIVWVYWKFFNNKYQVENDYKVMYNTQLTVKRNIKYIKNETDISKVKSPFFLTDSPGIIKKYFSKSKIIEKIIFNNNVFYVLSLNKI